jgi:DNA mismatch endonuclease, patch repair protein
MGDARRVTGSRLRQSRDFRRIHSTDSDSVRFAFSTSDRRFEMDTLSKRERSERMSRIRAKDTQPELRVRKLVFSLGYRYRLHVRDLPGTPDLVFPSRRRVIFVHGCFWHRHGRCALARLPKSRVGFWEPKLTANKRRDLRASNKLRRLGWSTMVIWECQTRDLDRLSRRITNYLG